MKTVRVAVDQAAIAANQHRRDPQPIYLIFRGGDTFRGASVSVRCDCGGIVGRFVYEPEYGQRKSCFFETLESRIDWE